MKRKSSKTSSVFWENFWKGMAAPVMLFADPEPTYIKPLELPQLSDADAIRSDWEKVGADMWRVIDREKEKLRASGHWTE